MTSIAETVIASEAKQSMLPSKDGLLRRFAPRNDDAERVEEPT
jgi:hypothetical protein